jgi:hypothetical protein
VSDRHSDFEAYGIDQIVLADMAGDEPSYEELVEALRDIVQQSRVGSGGRPVCRSGRINFPASFYHNARALLAKIEGDDW